MAEWDAPILGGNEKHAGLPAGRCGGPRNLKHWLFRPLVWGLLFVCAVAGAAWLYFCYFAGHMNRDNCAYNLHQIAQAIRLYADTHDGHYPDSFKTLLLGGELSPSTFACPVTADTESTGPTTQARAEELLKGRHLWYIYAGRDLTNDTSTNNTVVAYEPLSNHGDGMNVLFGDGHVEFVSREIGKKIEAQGAAGVRPMIP